MKCRVNDCLCPPAFLHKLPPDWSRSYLHTHNAVVTDCIFNATNQMLQFVQTYFINLPLPQYQILLHLYFFFDSCDWCDEVAMWYTCTQVTDKRVQRGSSDVPLALPGHCSKCVFLLNILNCETFYDLWLELGGWI